MGLVVTGISQTGDIKALEDALKGAGLALDPIQIVSPDDSTQGAASSLGGLANPGLMTGGGQGTGVPGLTNATPSGSGYGTRYFRNEALWDRLGDFAIPEDELDNYVDAVEAGRSVVAYFARPENVGDVESIFRTSDLAKVKVF